MACITECFSPRMVTVRPTSISLNGPSARQTQSQPASHTRTSSARVAGGSTNSLSRWRSGFSPSVHSTNYWSKRQPGQDKDVIENYGIDNYWCKDPEATIRFMSELERPWIAYKVLAAGAIHPTAGFKYAFAGGADFVLVGMFDFQAGENVAVANAVLASQENRPRNWMG